MTETDADQLHHPGQRIAKAMARAGLCSRRDAEAWILAGRVSVNGQKLASPAFNVVEGDDVRIDGEPLQARERTRLFLFHKPRGLVTTARDPEGKPLGSVATKAGAGWYEFQPIAGVRSYRFE